MSAAVRHCDYLIRKHCPRLMVAGAGALSQEKPGSGRRLSERQRARMVRLRRRGWGIKRIAAAIGCSCPPVSKVCSAAGLSRVKARNLTGAQVAQLFARRAQGWTQAAIARELGCSEAAVFRRLHRLNKRAA